MTHLTFFCEGLVGFVLLLSGFAKLIDLGAFAAVLRGYRLIPESFVRQASSLLPLTEILIGFGLLSGWSLFWFPVSAAGLFLCFATAVFVNLARGNRDIACGCFGSTGSQRIGWGIVGRSAFFATVAGSADFTFGGGSVVRTKSASDWQLVSPPPASSVVTWAIINGKALVATGVLCGFGMGRAIPLLAAWRGRTVLPVHAQLDIVSGSTAAVKVANGLLLSTAGGLLLGVGMAVA